MPLLWLVPLVEGVLSIAARHVHQEVLIRTNLVLTERILNLGRIAVQHGHLRVGLALFDHH